MIDLHLHSRASDGTLTPAELVALAAARGVALMALTDHDCTDGLTEAEAACRAAGIRFVAGAEISVTWEHTTLHVLALDVDRAHAGLQVGLAELQETRHERAREMGRRLEARGIADAYAGARKLARGVGVARTHFARFLCESGHVKDLQQAYRKYLSRGKPGYVPSAWAPLEECIGWIHAAGGQAVLAHPLRYELTRARLLRVLQAFKTAGGDGVEMISGRYDKDGLQLLTHLALKFGLAGSVGSDFHAPAPYSQPGVAMELPAGILPVWERFRDGGQPAPGLT